MDDNCVFCKIIKGEIPSRKVYEDDEIIAFYDIEPIVPIHILIIPKKHIPTLLDLKPEDEPVIGRIYSKINDIAKQVGLEKDGFRVIVNCKEDAGQVVMHVHFHILGGKKLGNKIVE